MAGTIEPNPILNKLVDFVNGWKPQKGISQTTVLSGDILTDFVNDLHDKIVEVAPLSGKPGQTLILYTGQSPSTGKNIYAELKEFCNSNHNFYYINSTDGGAVLWEREFKKAIIDVVGDKSVATRILSGKEFDISTGKPGARINQYAIDGTNILALDDFISQTLTMEAIKNGNPIMYVAGTNMDPKSVGALTELPEAMNELWIGKTIDEALANKITVVGDIDQITQLDRTLFSDVSLHQTKFYTDIEGKIVGVELLSDNFSDGVRAVVGTIDSNSYSFTYGSQLGIMSDAELIGKTSFLADCSDAELNAYRQFEYFTSQGADAATISKTGVMSNAELKSAHSFLIGCSDAELDAFRGYEFLVSRNADADVISKTGVMTDSMLKSKYGVLQNCNDSELMDSFRIYDYSLNAKTDTDVLHNLGFKSREEITLKYNLPDSCSEADINLLGIYDRFMVNDGVSSGSVLPELNASQREFFDNHGYVIFCQNLRRFVWIAVDFWQKMVYNIGVRSMPF